MVSRPQPTRRMFATRDAAHQKIFDLLMPWSPACWKPRLSCSQDWACEDDESLVWKAVLEMIQKSCQSRRSDRQLSNIWACLVVEYASRRLARQFGPLGPPMRRALQRASTAVHISLSLGRYCCICSSTTIHPSAEPLISYLSSLRLFFPRL